MRRSADSQYNSESFSSEEEGMDEQTEPPATVINEMNASVIRLMKETKPYLKEKQATVRNKGRPRKAQSSQIHLKDHLPTSK